MKKLSLLFIAVAILPLQLVDAPLPDNTQVSTEANGDAFSLFFTEVTKKQSRNDHKASKKATLPTPSGPEQTRDPDPEPVSDAGAEAFVAAYSPNCFAPEDRLFECVNDPDPENPAEPAEDGPASMTPAEFNTIMHTEFARLQVTGSGLDFQPKIDGIVGIDFILATNPEPQIHHTQLFDIPITIRATPVHYLWDLGNGDTVSTTDPGKGYPDQTVTYLYEEAGTYTVTLTTTWAGHFTIGNGTNSAAPWYPVAGTITTTETSEPIPHIVYKTKLIHPDYQGAQGFKP